MYIVDGCISFILALIGLGFLILIHEAGHYLMARRSGMRVEVFGIGFGRPIFSFLHKGVRINVCWIPFGGYVRIAGMETKSGEGPYTAPDGFFAKSPWARIKVALCGPLSNILFALLAFSIIWMTGGREKPFTDVTNRIGWLDPKSELYAHGVRPGDRIVSYNGTQVKTSKDHFYAAMTSGPTVSVEVEKLGSHPGEPQRLKVDVHSYQHPLALEKGILTTGVLSPASFLVWNPAREGTQPLSGVQEHSGILPSDRLVWVDGEFLVSQMQLSAVLNDGCLLVTVLRHGAPLNLNVPRLPVGELKVSPEVRGEISDWQYEAKIQTSNVNQLWFLPYNLTSDGVVEEAIPLFDQEKNPQEVWPLAQKLLPGDHIIAVAGQPVRSAVDIVKAFQEKRVLVVVDRAPMPKRPLGFHDADTLFASVYQSPELAQLIHSIGTKDQIHQNGSFYLLDSIVPRTRTELLSESGRAGDVQLLKEEEARILQAIEDPQVRSQAQQSIESRDRQLFLGLYGVHDNIILYNPDPLSICTSIGDEMYQTIVALSGGYLSPRWMSGPVGILHVIQQQWSIGYKEALFWLGTISLNLAVLNLLPLPVLDGGYILLSLFELLTGIRLKVETVEKIVLPFAILLIALLLYLTYNDLTRIFTHFFSNFSLWKG